MAGAFNAKEPEMKQGTISAVFIVGAAMWLAACSSGGDGGAGGGTPVAAPTLTGTFVDAPVAGLPYATSSGLGGTTNAQGQFSYRSGDTVTFSYGQNVVAPIPAAPQVTPWTMFVGLNSPDPADPRWINLARLLQTFNNVLPPVTPAIQALPAVDFQQSTAAFGADPDVGQLLTTAGVLPSSLVSEAQARLVLNQQFAILGSWFAQNGPNFIVFTAMADGTFTISEDGPTDPNGQDGMERGTYTWDRATGTFPATVQVDTNGQNGLSHTNPPLIAAVSGNENTLTITESGGTPFVLTRVVDTTGPIDPLVGAWRFDNTDGAGSLVVLTLLENGIFVLAGDEALPTSDGIERGTYSVAQNGDATLTRILDTNGGAGVFNPANPGPVVLNVVVNGDTMTITDGPDIFTGTRIRPPQ
jgi:hypothetical protein